jgi:superfamily II DNA helicase RecQ
LQYYQLMGRVGRGSRYSFGAESSKVTPERAARRRIIAAADPYERERREKEAEELAELEQAAEARAEGRLNRQWSRRY